MSTKKIRAKPNFLNFVIFSDNSIFKNNGQLNRRNCHYWSRVNPHWHRPIDNQHRWSVNVWCEIVNGYLVGLYFFDAKMSMGKTFCNFLEMIYYNYLKTLTSKHDRDYGCNSMGRHLTTQYMWDYLNVAYNDRLDEVDPSLGFHDLLIWCCPTFF